MKHIFTFLLIALILGFTNNFLNADSITVSGDVSGVWDVDTVNIAGNINIRDVETLEIQPGVIVNFLGEYHFSIHGCLKAEGSIMSPVVFTIADTTGFYNDTITDGGWKGIWIEDINTSVDSILLDYCHFEYGKAVAADSVHGYGGAVLVRNANKVRISDCTFQNNYAFYSGGAVYLENSDIIIKHNTFKWNSAGQTVIYYGYGGGICADWGEQVIEKNLFYQNSSTGIGGGLCIRFSDCPVYNNVFEDNYSALGGGFGILHIPVCTHFISNNLVVNNGALFFGSGTSTGDCSPTYVNNTIINNYGGAGGFYCKDSVVPLLYNNIIWGNSGYGGQVYLWDLLSQPNFYFNDIQGGKENFQGTGGSAFSGKYENNLDADPLFTGTGDFPFALQDESPCVNAGTTDIPGYGFLPSDLAGNTRIYGNEIDMGAYENQHVFSRIQNHSFSDAVFYEPSPNPAREIIHFSFYLLQNSSVRLEIFDLKGNNIAVLINQKLVGGIHQAGWNLRVGSDYAKGGIYFCRLIVDGRNFEKKVVVE